MARIIARCRLKVRVQRSHASTHQVWVRGCSSSTFLRAKIVKNRVHLDVRVGTGLVGDERLAALEAECARLITLGATRVRLLPADDHDESCIVMQDIEGNEFVCTEGIANTTKALRIGIERRAHATVSAERCPHT